jgi:hypothetical protein
MIYRSLIGKLMRVGGIDYVHVTAELIRSLFDIESMLYFVAPEWWKPRKVSGSPQSVTASDDEGQPLTPANRVSWGGAEATGRPNYLVTENSAPAPLGSSLGWLIQLDGDNHRNAFLNSPWVKAVIPIRPGREVAAIKWLQAAHVEGTGSLDLPYGGTERDLQGLTIGNALMQMAESLAQSNTDIKNTLETERVFESGFDPLDGGFRASGKPYTVFDQWIEILPTDQVVATEYELP